MSRLWTDDEQMMSGWWADDERMICRWYADDMQLKCIWWADDDRMKSRWWAGDERMMSEWWADDEQMMSGWWTDDERMMSGWWADDERMMSRWWVDEQMTTDWLLADYWLTTGMPCDFCEIAAYWLTDWLTWVVSRDASASKNQMNVDGQAFCKSDTDKLCPLSHFWENLHLPTLQCTTLLQQYLKIATTVLFSNNLERHQCIWCCQGINVPLENVGKFFTVPAKTSAEL